MKALLFAIILCSSVRAEEDELYSAVEKYTASWAEVFPSGPSVNGLAALEQVAPRAKLLLELGRPLSNLIAAGTTLTFKNGSVEERAMAKANEDMTQLLGKDSLLVRDQASRNIKHLADHEFVLLISMELEAINTFYGWITGEHFGVRYSGAGSLKGPCDKLYTFRVMRDLENMFNTRCSMPTVESQRRYVEIVEAIHEIEYGFTKKDYQIEYRGWGQAVFTLKSLIHVFDDTDEKTMLKELHSARGSSKENATKTVWGITARFPHPYRSGGYFCRLSAFFDAGDHKRQLHYDSLLQLTVALKRVLIFTTTCSNMTTDGIAELMDLYEKETVERVTSLAQFAIDWTKQAMELDWPTGPVTFAKHVLRKTYDSSLTTISVDSYNKTAALLRKSFNETGDEELDYQVLVSRPMKSEIDYQLMQVHESNYTLISNFLGIDAHFFRYNATKKALAGRALTWLRVKTDEILGTFKLLTETQASDSGKKKMETVSRNHGPFENISEDMQQNYHHFHNAILFSTQSYDTNASLLHIGEAIDVAVRFGDERQVGKVELYQHFPFYYRDFSYKFYMLH